MTKIKKKQSIGRSFIKFTESVLKRKRKKKGLKEKAIFYLNVDAFPHLKSAQTVAEEH